MWSIKWFGENSNKHDIMTKKELKERLKIEASLYGGKWSFFRRLLLWNENYRIAKLIYHLRWTEYFRYNINGMNRLLYGWHYWNLRRYSIKSDIILFPNNFDTGLLLMHPGFRRIGNYVRCGKNCTILPMVLMGKKKPGIDCKIEIGDNCYISTGVTILGPLKIGNNVTISAGAVVTHDIPDNVIVGGVPAKVIKVKSN